MRHIDRTQRRAPLAISLVLTLTLAAAVLGPPHDAAQGFPDISAPYTSDDSDHCDTDEWVDPINVLWHGAEATASNSEMDLMTHTSWDNASSGAQYLRVKVDGQPADYACREMQRSRATKSDFTPEARFHTRLWHIPASFGDNKKTVGDAHHEDFVTGSGCGFPGSHAVDSNGPRGSGFDKGRAQLREKYLPTAHALEVVLWGNTNNFGQCDGDVAGSDGHALRIRVNDAH